jgi:hypothetical protein
MSEVQKVNSPKRLGDLISLSNLSDATVVLAGNTTQTGKLTLLQLRQYLNVDAIDTDFAGVLASINTLNTNVAQNTSDIESLNASVATKLGYVNQSSNTFVPSPLGEISFSVEGSNSFKITENSIDIYLPSSSTTGLSLSSNALTMGDTGKAILFGENSPQGRVVAKKGTMYIRTATNGYPSNWIKREGDGNLGWEPL